jgi:hypothetical protein
VPMRSQQPAIDEAVVRAEPGHEAVRLMTAPVEGWLASRGSVITEVRCDCQVHQGRVITRLWEGKDSYWLWNESVATFHIQPGRGRIDVYPEFGADEQTIANVLRMVSGWLDPAVHGSYGVGCPHVERELWGYPSCDLVTSERMMTKVSTRVAERDQLKDDGQRPAVRYNANVGIG